MVPALGEGPDDLLKIEPAAKSAVNKNDEGIGAIARYGHVQADAPGVDKLVRKGSFQLNRGGGKWC